MYPQFVIAQQLALPNAPKILFRLNVSITILAGLLPMGVLYYCLGTQAFLGIGIYLLVMSSLPGKLANMSYVLQILRWFCVMVYCADVFFLPTSRHFWETVSIATPLLVAFLLMAIIYWGVTWWRVFHCWPFQGNELEKVRRESSDEIQERYQKSDWFGAWWNDWGYRRIKSLSSKQFLGRVRLTALVYGDPTMWVSGALFILLFFCYLHFCIIRSDLKSEPISIGIIYWLSLLINTSPLATLPISMTRWRDSLALHRLFPVANRTAIREAAIVFAATMLKTWLVCVLVFSGCVYFFADHSAFEKIPSILLFSIAFLTLQYGCAILFVIVRENDFFAVLNAFSLISLAILFGLWYWIGWPVSLVLLLLGVYVSYGAYRRLHTVEPAMIGKSENL